MDRVGIKLWAKEKTRSNKWNIWKGFLAIFAASLGLSFIAIFSNDRHWGKQLL